MGKRKRGFEDVWNPHPKTRELLDRAMWHIESVPYKVSLRWVFYRLLQDGYFQDGGMVNYRGKLQPKRTGKKAYNSQWVEPCTGARKEFHGGEWYPGILIDDTKERIERAGGFADMAHLKARFVEYVADNVGIQFDHFIYQKDYVIIGFEAHAMSEQFRRYSSGVDLLPFGGSTSTPFKWDIAGHLRDCFDRYQKPIRFLYFGDCDDYGPEIFENALKDIEKWIAMEHPEFKSPPIPAGYFTHHWCGLTKAQAKTYSVKPNPDKPGQFQWEALTDAAAQAIIFEGMATFLDLDLKERWEAESQRVTAELREKIREALAPIADQILL